MSKKEQQPHPLLDNEQRISNEGIVILNDVHGLPTEKKPFVSPDYVICIGHRGHIQMTYDGMPDYSEEHTVAAIFPNHELVEVYKTPDYLATLIVVRNSELNDSMLQIINQMRYRYEKHPNVKLTKHEYKIVMNVVEVMLETYEQDLHDRHMLHSRQLEFLLRLLGHYRNKKMNEMAEKNKISNDFKLRLDIHFKEHHDVKFYASLACLSTKYFSDIIRKETGKNASFWIHTKIITEAKMLLHTRHDLTIQSIADMLGFNEQASFCRYFHRETGTSPSEFRN